MFTCNKGRTVGNRKGGRKGSHRKRQKKRKLLEQNFQLVVILFLSKEPLASQQGERKKEKKKKKKLTFDHKSVSWYVVYFFCPSACNKLGKSYLFYEDHDLYVGDEGLIPVPNGDVDVCKLASSSDLQCLVFAYVPSFATCFVKYDTALQRPENKRSCNGLCQLFQRTCTQGSTPLLIPSTQMRDQKAMCYSKALRWHPFLDIQQMHSLRSFFHESIYIDFVNVFLKSPAEESFHRDLAREFLLKPWR